MSQDLRHGVAAGVFVFRSPSIRRPQQCADHMHRICAATRRSYADLPLPAETLCLSQVPYSGSLSKSPVNRSRDALPHPRRSGSTRQLHRRGIHRRHSHACRQFLIQTTGRHQSRQLAFDGRLKQFVLVRRDADSMQNQSFDLNIDFQATTSPSTLAVFGFASAGQYRSASLTGRSSLPNSARAASKTSGIVIGVFSLAARKAAFSATL